MRIIFPYSSGEYYRVHSSHRRGVAPYEFYELMHYHILYKLASLISRFSSRFYISVVAGFLRNSEYSGFFIHHFVHFFGRHMFFFHYERNYRRVDRAAAGSHDESFERGQAHRGVEAFPAVYRGH